MGVSFQTTVQERSDESIRNWPWYFARRACCSIHPTFEGMDPFVEKVDTGQFSGSLRGQAALSGFEDPVVRPKHVAYIVGDSKDLPLNGSGWSHPNARELSRPVRVKSNQIDANQGFIRRMTEMLLTVASL